MINEFLMNGPEETLRLDRKTDPELVKKQAIWAGIKPGMRVADLGCGSGKTTFILNKLIQPGGEILGVDFSRERIEFARQNYSDSGINFVCKDIRDSLEGFGKYDFIWIRFVLEYYLSNSLDILKNVSKILNPGGILLLIDLDYNCLSHYGISKRLEITIAELMKTLQKKANFDPYAGRKLYTYLYDLNYEDIIVDVLPHNLIYASINEKDEYNSFRKIETMISRGMLNFKRYNGGKEELMNEFEQYLADPRKFYYSPMICCRGRKIN